MSIEKVIDDYFHEPMEDAKAARLMRNQMAFGLTAQDAEILDQKMVDCVRACLSALARSIDSMSVAGGLRSAALKLYPEVVARNFEELLELKQTVEIMTDLEGIVITPNPEKPNCDCAACNMIREMSAAMVAVSATQH